MPDHRTLPPPPAAGPRGQRLARPDYRADFLERERGLADVTSWKLERLQHFEEEGNASREALRRGEWEEALRLIEARREGLAKARQEQDARGHVFRRVRIVEEPFTPYLQWELHSLRLQDEYGTRVRVVDAETVRQAETGGLLPEVVVLGETTMYEIKYAEDGTPDGAVRSTDPGLVRAWKRYIEDLYVGGEDIQSFFRRRVAHLPPPTVRARRG